jgi:hypothetical protein
MTKAQIAAAIQAIVRLQLDDCKRAIKDGTKTIALNELEDAIRQLKLLANAWKPDPHSIRTAARTLAAGTRRANQGGRRTKQGPMLSFVRDLC